MRIMNVYKVIVGEYEDKSIYIVKGAKDADDAEAQVKAWYKENYCGSLDWEMIQVELITIKKGVTRL